MQSFHQSVMIAEVIHYLKPKSNQNFIDCTLGSGGHAKAILQRTSPQGKLLGIDLDSLAIKLTKENLAFYKNRLILIQDNFRNLEKIVKKHHFENIFGILLDLGISSNQLRDNFRGFSFLSTGSLDMRFDPNQSDLTAQQILNTWPEKKLYEIFKNFGEEKLAKPISQKIIEIRQKTLVTSPSQLVEIVADVYKKYYHSKSKIHPATKVFQALRIAVNRELENLQSVLPQAVDLLNKGGRLAVISYHSLEDRIVKAFFRQESRDCICPPEMPICQCNHKKTLNLITKKPIIPTDKEIAENPRSRSAKLRVAEKI